MEKLELKNGEQIEIKDGASENFFRVEVENMEEFQALRIKLTNENLSLIKFINEAGSVCGVYEEKTLVGKFGIEELKDEEKEQTKLIITLTLADIDKMNKRMSYVEETLDTLVLNSLGVE